MIEAELNYDGDILKSVVIQKGLEERPLWGKVEILNPDQMIMWVDRFDSLCAIASEWALAQALETASGITVSKRAQFVRTLLAEVNRLVWLTTYLGRIFETLGSRSLYQQIMVLREQVLTVQEELTGGRILPQAFCVGGTRRELPVGNVQKVRQFAQGWEFSWNLWLEQVAGDSVLESRLSGLMTIPKYLIEKWAWWGIAGKASGVAYDARKQRPYGAYPYLDFQTPLSNLKYGESTCVGDAWGRFNVVLDEVKLSLNLIQQTLKLIPSQIEEKKKIEGFTAGLHYGYAESAKGTVIAVIETTHDHVANLRLLTSGQRVWPFIDGVFTGIRAEDFDLAFNSLGIDPEEAEL